MKWILAVALCLVSTTALADPITVGMAAMSAGFATYTGAAAIAALGMTTFQYFALNFVGSLALSYLSTALAPKPKKFAGAQLGYQVAGIAAAQDHAVIYGQTRIGGVIVYKEATEENKYLHTITAIAGHECEEIVSVYLNDEILTLDGNGICTAPTKYENKVRVIKHLGADDQVADSTLIDESDGKWTADHRLRGICYAYIRMEFNADSFPNGEPSVTFLVKGKKVYNPNTDVTEWTDNSALCLRDYITSEYGLNDQNVDDDLFIAAANICDESVALSGGGTQSRYTCNGSFTTSEKPKDTIDYLLTSMGGTIWYAQGKWKVKAAAWITPLLAFDEDDLRSSIKISTRHSRRDNFNTVRGTFKGPETNYMSSDYPQIKSSSFINIDGGQSSIVDFDFPFTDTASMAQRLAKIGLYRNREQLTVSASFGLRAFQVQVGDIVKITNERAGWNEKTFEVVNWTFRPDESGTIVVDMTLREISAAVFDWDAEEQAFESNNTTLADPFFVPDVGISVSSEARVINEHLVNVLLINVTSNAGDRIDQVQVEYKKSSDTNYKSAGFGDLGIFEVIDVEDQQNYDVRARAINTFGIKGDFASRDGFFVQNLADPPADVTDFSFNVGPSGILLEWEPVPDLDLSFYRIRYSFVESGATFGSAITAVSKVARPANSVLVPPRSGTYLIKAYDKSGNQSVSAASVVVRQEDLDTYATFQQQTEHSSFSGTKTGCSVDSGRLRITDPSTAPSSATYEFSNYIDTGSVRVVRCGMEIENIRIDDSPTVTFDTLSGNFDSLPGLFDDLTGGSNFSDTDIIQYVATTDDNPASSPTWSDWKRFKAGDFSGRAFKFKIELKSTAEDITPALQQLAATARY